MTTSRPYPRPAEAAVLLTVLALLVAEELALGLAEEEDRPVINAVLIGASGSGLLAVGAVLLGRWLDTRRPLPLPPPGPNGREYSARALADFPMDAVRPLLLAHQAPQLGQLYSAWMLARAGRPAPWIARRLAIPLDAAHLLVDAARARAATRPGHQAGG
ncbi:hypothetical protein P3T27_004063 [Kitasatospora sp. MAA19]|uniref:hypothetical protein n=1 Tax=Kitasatospora sp. MAA19 TaxID=3035090 RepID=UPI002475D2A8|nr:hypothetical protein [Kitasatospora sp. MAA19]MDH6707326.1 hypothetical protein [Kitasatospora sp. MAA19]